ncbi:putative AraC type helix-turn-helix-domain-containing protein [Desulfovibrio ferrophilus]|uniref:Putative AraC type helix-turn-helix-domain-containing protein n=2 Tax=Desulfovibrio ferrophilus TaxID=241368 RepID=A0A2Z6AVT5_9BACT|nr:putative AraC type helix-turn-helix-domain-containing protein [Desulfovibrio ferrophilus]
MAFTFLNQNFVADAGSVNLTVPGEMHDGHAAVLEGWAYRMLYLDPGVVENAASQAAGRPVAAPDFATGVIHDHELATQVRACHQILDHPHASLLAQQSALLSMLGLWIKRHAAERPPSLRAGTEPTGVARARAFMDEQCEQDISLDELAQQAHLSPYHFLRVFRRAVGAPPHAYLMNARIRRARQLLRTTIRLADIAQEIGFSDQAHFTNAFKRFTGLTPGKYRKHLQN